MVDTNCPYVESLPWEHGGGVDHYCNASCRPQDKYNYEAPSTPLCDSKDYRVCSWALNQKCLEVGIDGYEEGC